MSATASTNQLDVLESPAERRQAMVARLILFGGASSLGLVVGGTLIVVLLHGLLPYERIVEGLLAPETRMVLYTGVGLGLLAVIAGFTRYRAMPTKRSRERSIAGGVLGIQALILGLILIVFREAGDPDRFVFHFM